MKKYILMLMIVGLAGTLTAQDFAYRRGEKTNGKAYSPKMIRIAEGVQEGQLLVVEPELKAVSTPGSNPVKAVKVRLCDMEWQDTRSVTLDNTKKSSIDDVFRTGSRLHVLVSNDVDKKLLLRHMALDAQSLEVLDDGLLAEVPLQKGDETYVWTVASPSGQYHGVVYAVWGKKNDGEAVAMLFDRDMNKLWEQRLAYSDVFATDDGAIATMRMGMVEDNNALTAFRVNVATADGEKHGEYVLDADVSDVALLGCDGSKVLAVALEGKGGYGLLRVGLLGNRKYTGLWGLLFDLDSRQITVANRHPFTDDELLTLSNEAAGGKVMERSVYFVRKVDDCLTPQGGAVLYQHAWHEETRDAKTGMTRSETVYSKGILLVQADMEGRLTVSRIPQNNQNAGWPDVGADLFAHNGKVYVVTNESKEENDEYTPDRPAKRSNSLIMANGALAVYWFTPDGQGAKRVVVREHKAILNTPLYAGEGNRYYFLTTSSLKPHISSLTLPQ